MNPIKINVMFLYIILFLDLLTYIYKIVTPILVHFRKKKVNFKGSYKRFKRLYRVLIEINNLCILLF